jgi:hypothetical protein
VDEKLTARRAAQQGFNDCSFPTIAGAARTDSPGRLHRPKEPWGSWVGKLPCCRCAAWFVANTEAMNTS